MATTQALAGYSDDGWNEENELCANLSTANHAIARYIIRHLDADAGRKSPTPASDELQLGRELIDLGNRLTARARGRAADSVWNTYDSARPARDQD
ncbi:hypothetical protein Acsp05_12430 [Actinokineospora sp. NBRC 105648]|nr:hypothetical protein Acsp05_12430 [Actinokineospora sp. NBRC 105648]